MKAEAERKVAGDTSGVKDASRDVEVGRYEPVYSKSPGTY